MKANDESAMPDHLPLTLVAATAFLFLWSLASPAVVTAQSCTPSANEIALFADENYHGVCVIKGIGEHRVFDPPPRGFSSPKQVHFQSIRVGRNVAALACTKPNLVGECAPVYQDRADFSGRSEASFIVRPRTQPQRCQPNADHVTFWEREYFFGQCWTDGISVDAFNGIGTIPSFGSVKVGENVEVLACSEMEFVGHCVVFNSGVNDRLDRATFSANSMFIRRHNQAPECDPGSNQVAVWGTGHFIGRCKVLGVGRYSGSEVGQWYGWVRSLKVGANVKFTKCTPSRGGAPPACAEHAAGPGLNLHFYRDDSMIVARHDDGRSSPGRDDRNEQTFTVWLASHAPLTGYPWWTGRYPTVGRLDGNLTRVANPRNSVWLGLLKPGYTSVDCGNSDAYVLVLPGQTVTADQMRTVFGSANPVLPVNFVACSGDVADTGPDGGLRFHALPLNITYTTQR